MAQKFLDGEGLKYYDGLVKEEIGKKQDAITNLETIIANAEAGAGLASKVDGIQSGAQVNVIETVKVDNQALTVENKAVNIDLSGKADKSTTLAGYGITDAYTQTETDAVVAAKIAEIVNENNNEKIDTLKEIADWIVNDTTGAAQMANDIADLKTNTADLSTIKADAQKGAQFATSHATDEVGAQVNKIESITVNGQAVEIGDGKVVNIDLAASSVQFSTEQTAAINSGITSDLVEKYDGYETTIAGKLDATEISALTNEEILKLIQGENA